MIPNIWRRWVSRLFKRPVGKVIRRRPRRGLYVEMLEDRVVPSTDNWTGAAGTLLWGTAGNWSAGVPVAGEALNFPSTAMAGTFATVDNLSSSTTIGSITFAASGYSITTLAATPHIPANTLVVTGNIVATANLGASVALGGPQINGLLELDPTAVNSYEQTITVNQATLLDIAATVSGVTPDQTLFKSGIGTLELDAANTAYQGAINLNANGGIVQITNNDALGNNTIVPTSADPYAGVTTVNNNAQLEVGIVGGANITVPENLILNGPGINNNGAVLNVSGNNTWTGLVQLDDSDVYFGSSSGNLSFSNTISDAGAGSSVTKVGFGAITFDHNGTGVTEGDTYRGQTIIDNGILVITDPESLGAGSNPNDSENGTAGSEVIVNYSAGAQTFGTLEVDYTGGASVPSTDPQAILQNPALPYNSSTNPVVGFMVFNDPIILNGPGDDPNAPGAGVPGDAGGTLGLGNTQNYLGALYNAAGANIWDGNVTLGSITSSTADPVTQYAYDPLFFPVGLPTSTAVVAVASRNDVFIGSAANSSINIQGQVSSTLTSQYPDAPLLDKVQPGLVILSDDNTYPGGTEVDQGDLQITDSTALGTGNVWVGDDYVWVRENYLNGVVTAGGAWPVNDSALELAVDSGLDGTYTVQDGVVVPTLSLGRNLGYDSVTGTGQGANDNGDGVLDNAALGMTNEGSGQEVYIPESGSGTNVGAFTLTFEGQTTSSLQSDVSAANLAIALNALSEVTAAGGVTVTQDANVYRVIFGNGDTEDVPLMSINSTIDVAAANPSNPGTPSVQPIYGLRVSNPIIDASTGDGNDEGGLNSISGINTYTGAITIGNPVVTTDQIGISKVYQPLGTSLENNFEPMLEGAFGVELDTRPGHPTADNSYYSYDWKLLIPGANQINTIDESSMYKYGLGQLVLAENNDAISGPTFIEAGWITIEASNSLGPPIIIPTVSNLLQPDVITVASGASLQLLPPPGDSIEPGNNLIISGLGIPAETAAAEGITFHMLTEGAILSLGGDNTLTGTIQLDGLAGIGVDDPILADYPGESTLTTTGEIEDYQGPPSVSGGIEKLGTRELIIQGPGTYTGANIIESGTVLLQNNTGLGLDTSGTGLAAAGNDTYYTTDTTVESGGLLELGNNVPTEDGGIATGVEVTNEELNLNSGGQQLNVSGAAGTFTLTYTSPNTGATVVTAPINVTLAPATLASAIANDLNAVLDPLFGFAAGTSLASVVTTPVVGLYTVIFEGILATVENPLLQVAYPVANDPPGDPTVTVNGTTYSVYALDDNLWTGGITLSTSSTIEAANNALFTVQGTISDGGASNPANLYLNATQYTSNFNPPTFAITAAKETGSTVTITTSTPLTDLPVGDTVTVSGITPAGFDGTFVVTSVNTGTDKFTYTDALGLGTGAVSSASAIVQPSVDNGQLVLSGANTYYGSTLVNTGILTVANSSALGQPTSGTQAENIQDLDITTTGASPSGSFQLSFNGYTTSPITFSGQPTNTNSPPNGPGVDELATAIQNALDSLNSIGGVSAGSVTVTPKSFLSSDYQIVFNGDSLTGYNIPEIGVPAFLGTGLVSVTPIVQREGVGGVTVVEGAQMQIEGNLSIAGKSLEIAGDGQSAADTPSSIPITWEQVGPAPINNGQTNNGSAVTGRVTGVATDPSDPNVIYISTAGGGAWKTINDGLTWIPLFDGLPEIQTLTLASPTPAVNGFTIKWNGSAAVTVPGLAAEPNVPLALQIQNALDSLTTIGGVGGTVTVTEAGNVYTVTFGGTLIDTPEPTLITTNSGAITVVQIQLGAGSSVAIYSGAIAIDPDNVDTIYLGTGEADNSGDSFYGTGVYVTFNYGQTWSLLTGISNYGGVSGAPLYTGSGGPTGNNPLYGDAVSQIVVATNRSSAEYGPGNYEYLGETGDPYTIYVSTSDAAVNDPDPNANNAGVWRYTGHGPGPNDTTQGGTANTAAGETGTVNVGWTDLTSIASTLRAGGNLNGAIIGELEVTVEAGYYDYEIYKNPVNAVNGAPYAYAYGTAGVPPAFEEQAIGPAFFNQINDPITTAGFPGTPGTPGPQDNFNVYFPTTDEVYSSVQIGQSTTPLLINTGYLDFTVDSTGAVVPALYIALGDPSSSYAGWLDNGVYRLLEPFYANPANNGENVVWDQGDGNLWSVQNGSLGSNGSPPTLATVTVTYDCTPNNDIPTGPTDNVMFPNPEMYSPAVFDAAGDQLPDYGMVKISTVGQTIYASMAWDTNNALLDGDAELEYLYYSTDGGHNWEETPSQPPNDLGTQGDYDNVVLADPSNPNDVFLSGCTTYNFANGDQYPDQVLMSSNGGAGPWVDISDDAGLNGPHTDEHAMTLDANGNLIVGSDGGLWEYELNPNGANPNTWIDLNGNLAITTENTVSTAPGSPQTIIAGSQDNGTELDNPAVNNPSEIPNQTPEAWDLVGYGDGGDVAYDPQNGQIVYAINDGDLSISTQAGAVGTFNSILDIGGLYFPYVVDSVNSNRIVAGGSYTNPSLYESLNEGTSWEVLNQGTSWNNLQAFYENDPPYFIPFLGVTSLSIAEYQGESGADGAYVADPAFPDVTDLGANTYDPGVVYITDGYHLAVSLDDGLNWSDRTPGNSNGGTIQQLVVDPTNRNDVYAVYQAAPGGGNEVLYSTNAGQTWTDITTAAGGLGSADLPNVPFWSLAIDPRTDTLYLGTDTGVYTARIDAADPTASTVKWSRYGVGLPNVQGAQLSLDLSTNTLTIATYGRSIYQVPIDNPIADSGALRVVAGTSDWTGPIMLTGATDIEADGMFNVPLAEAQLNIQGTISDLTYRADFPLTINNITTNSANYFLDTTTPDEGVGTFIFSGDNLYGGATTVYQGILVANNYSALGVNGTAGDPGVGTTILDGATLELSASLDDVPIVLYGNGYSFNGHYSGSLDNITGDNSFSGQITLEDDGLEDTVTIGVVSGTELTLTGSIISPEEPIESASETGETVTVTTSSPVDGLSDGDGVTITGLSPSGFDGSYVVTSINGDTFTYSPEESITAIGETTPGDPGLVTVTTSAPMTGLAVGESVTIAGVTPLGYDGTFTVTSVDLNTYSFTYTATPGLGAATLKNATAVIVNLGTATVTNALVELPLENPNNLYAGNPEGGLIKEGTGTLVLDDANSYLTPWTYVYQGVLQLMTSTALGDSSGVHILDGTQLQVNNPSSTVPLVIDYILTVNGSGLSDDGTGAILDVGGDVVWSGLVTLYNPIPAFSPATAPVSNIVIGADAGTLLSITGTIADPLGYGLAAGEYLPLIAGVLKVGLGTVELSGNNIYSGTTVVAAGILDVQGDNALGERSNTFPPSNTAPQFTPGLNTVEEITTVDGAPTNSAEFSVSFAGVKKQLLYGTSSGAMANAFNAPGTGIFAQAGIVGMSVEVGEVGYYLANENQPPGYGPSYGLVYTLIFYGDTAPTAQDSLTTIPILAAGVGGVTANAGIISAGGVDVLVDNGAQLQLDNSVVAPATLNISDHTLTLNGDGPNGTGALYNIAGDNEWSGPVILASDTTVGAVADTSLTLTKVESVATQVAFTVPPEPFLTVADPGTVIFPAGATFTGQTTYADDAVSHDLGNTIITDGDLQVDSGAIGSIELAGGTLSGTGAAGPITSVQTVTVGGPAGGYYTLTFNGQPTVDITLGASAATVQQDLDNLSTIGGVGGAVTVTENANGTVYYIDFSGTLVDTPLLLTSTGHLGATATVDAVGTGGEIDGGDNFPTQSLETLNDNGTQPNINAALYPPVDVLNPADTFYVDLGAPTQAPNPPAVDLSNSLNITNKSINLNGATLAGQFDQAVYATEMEPGDTYVILTSDYVANHADAVSGEFAGVAPASSTQATLPTNSEGITAYAATVQWIDNQMFVVNYYKNEVTITHELEGVTMTITGVPASLDLSNGAYSYYGQNLIWTVTIVPDDPGSNATVTGNISISCTGPSGFNATLPINPATGQVIFSLSSLDTGPLAEGVYTIGAAYDGYPAQPPLAPPVTQEYTTASAFMPSWTVEQAPTTVGLSNPGGSSIVYSENITLQVTVSSAVNSPTGSPVSGTLAPTLGAGITFENIGSATATLTNTTSTGTTTTFTYNIAGLQSGKFNIIAVYNGDTNYTGNTSGASTVTVTVAPTQTFLHSTSATVPASPPPYVYGEPITFTAEVEATGGATGAPTGTVVFERIVSGQVNVVLGTETLTPSGGPDSVAYCTVTQPSLLITGTQEIEAVYDGVLNEYTGSTGTLPSFVVQKDPTTVTNLSATINSPPTSTTTSTYGQSVTFTANVLAGGPGSGYPTTTVNFYNGTPGPSTLMGSGTLSTVNIASGTNLLVNGANDLLVAPATGFTPAQLASYVHDTLVISGGTNWTPGDYLITGVNGSYWVLDFATTVAGNTNGNVNEGDWSLGVATASFTTTLPTQLPSNNNSTLNVTATYGGDANYAPTAAGQGAVLPFTVDKASTTTVMVSATTTPPTSQPYDFGQAVTLTAQVNPVAPGAGSPTGTVNFYLGSTSDYLGSGTLSTTNGVTTAQYTTSALPVGTDDIIAEYVTGDSNFYASTSPSAALPVQIIGDNTTTALSTSAPLPGGSVWGQPVTFTATVAVSAPGSGNPTGTVYFYLNGSPTSFGSGALSTNPSTGVTSASYTTTGFSLPLGSNTITASYAPSLGSDYNSSNSNSVTQLVSADATATTVSSSGPTVYGNPATFTITVSSNSPGSGAPQGTVSLELVQGIYITQLGQATYDPAASSANSSVYKFTTAGTQLPVGANQTIEASFTDTDGDYLNSTGTTSQTVNPGSAGVTVTSNATPAYYGEAVTFTATVNPSGSIVPTGTVAFYDGSTYLGTGTLPPGSSTTSYTTTAFQLAVGPNQVITADYSGDTNYQPESGTMNPDQNVDADPTTTLLSLSTTAANVGQVIAFTANVTPEYSPGTPISAGTVTFKDTTTNTTLGTATIANGVAVCDASLSATGAQTIEAIYNGSTDYATSNTLSQSPQPVVTVTAVGTRTSKVVVASSLNPSQYGQQVTFTATVTDTGTAPAQTPLGTVDFLAGSTLLGTGTLTAGASGTATASYMTFPDQLTLSASGGTQTYSITAVYAGNSTFAHETSAALTQTVNPVPTETSTVTLSSSANPVTYGSSLTFTAVVAAGAGESGDPTGTVEFLEEARGGSTFTEMGTKTISTATSNTITYTYSTSTLAAGTYTIEAVYEGDIAFEQETSNTITQVVNAEQTTTTLKSSANPSVFGQAVTLTSTVKMTASGAAAAGTVTFSYTVPGSTTAVAIGTVTLSSGTATLKTTALPTGVDTVTATYNASNPDIGSSTAVLNQTVNQASTTSAIKLSTTNSNVPITISVTVKPVLPGAGTPTGTVYFYIDNLATPVGSASVINGVATFTYTPGVSTGDHTIMVEYGGDSNFLSSSATDTNVDFTKGRGT